MSRITEADKILYNHGLLNILKKYGTPYIVGSYRMDLKTWNDIDIYIDSDNMTLNKLYNFASDIFTKFNPTWFEGKGILNNGRTDYFMGFETEVLGDLWNVDIWFFSKETIDNTLKSNDEIIKKINENPNLKTVILDIKTQLKNSGEYGTKYTSIDVYNAVINNNVKNITDFRKFKL